MALCFCSSHCRRLQFLPRPAELGPRLWLFKTHLRTTVGRSILSGHSFSWGSQSYLGLLDILMTCLIKDTTNFKGENHSLSECTSICLHTGSGRPHRPSRTIPTVESHAPSRRSDVDKLLECAHEVLLEPLCGIYRNFYAASSRKSSAYSTVFPKFRKA